MTGYKIADAKVGVLEDAAIGGPMGGLVVAEVKLVSDDETVYISEAEIEGFPQICKTEESTFDAQLDVNKILDDNFSDMLTDHIIAPGSYEEIFEQKDNPWYDAIRYVIYLVRCEMDEAQPFIDATAGKLLDEIDIPDSDVEEDYKENN